MAAGDITQGNARPADTKPWDLGPGDYCVRNGFAWVVTPNGNGPSRLEGWDLTQHEDGTITTSPSILAHPAGDMPGWHGYLERGVWREV